MLRTGFRIEPQSTAAMNSTHFITRIAPSPTGYFHLGTARTAYFNWLAARASGGRFLLRIDDTDRLRNNDAFLDVIYQALDYLGLDYDQTFKQSDRADRHLQVAQDLLKQGRAVARDGAIFLDHPLDKSPSFQYFTDDAVGKVAVTQADHDFVRNMVLIKSDGTPTYHFASVVDDIDHGVNYVLRGADHISNTVKQAALYLALGAPLPRYGHVGLLHDHATGKKLSKSTGAPSLLDYKTQDIDPDAMCNFLLRLGWGPKVDDKSTAVLPRARALDLFLAGGKLRAASAKADFTLLQSLDRKYKGARRSAGT
jgi:glutamyl/glutaminyl-tRNA synthetase